MDLESVSDSVIGKNSSLNVTLKASDDPHGIISFSDSPTNLNQQNCKILKFLFSLLSIKALVII